MKRHFQFGLHTVASVFFILSACLVARSFQTQVADRTIESVRAALRDDRTAGNSALISRRIADFESLGLANCITLTSDSAGEIYNTLFKDSCHAFRMPLSPTVLASGRVDSINGDKFTIRFRSEPVFFIFDYI